MKRDEQIVGEGAFVFDRQIIEAVVLIQRRCGRVYATMVQAHLDFYRAEQTIREDMARMAKAGQLERLGERKGYRVGRAA